MYEDSRLNRLLEYTKFHIGIYFSFAGGLLAWIGTSSNPIKYKYLTSLIGNPLTLYLSLMFIAIAGFAGGIIASGCTQYRTFDELWDKPQGPAGIKIYTGKT